MKKTSIILAGISLLFGTTVFSQAAGNINYPSGNQNYQTQKRQIRFPKQNINVNAPSTSVICLDVKGLANVKADTYVAIFSVTQVGKTAEEVNQLMNDRISPVLTDLKNQQNVETFIDMISFVPVYEYEIDKKIFSKKNYNEIPKGFELKKNIHIRFKDPNQLNDFITLLSKQEIYDLVRVDYFSSNLENIKKELMTKAKEILQQKQKNYETILGAPFTNVEKGISDGYQVVLPVEMYQSYESYNSSSLNLKKSANINVADKSKTLYYQPILDKEFDFVINPTILEPVIQVLYEVKLVVMQEKKTVDSGKEYLLITPNGEMKTLDIKK